MKLSTLAIGGAVLAALALFSRGATAAPRNAAIGGGQQPYFPGEGVLPPKLTNWSPDLYARLGSLFLQPAIQPTQRTVAPDSLDRVRLPVRDVYAAVQPDVVQPSPQLWYAEDWR